jgi:hypothetical protein
MMLVLAVQMIDILQVTIRSVHLAVQYFVFAKGMILAEGKVLVTVRDRFAEDIQAEEMILPRRSGRLTICKLVVFPNIIYNKSEPF